MVNMATLLCVYVCTMCNTTYVCTYKHIISIIMCVRLQYVHTYTVVMYTYIHMYVLCIVRMYVIVCIQGSVAKEFYVRM